MHKFNPKNHKSKQSTVLGACQNSQLRGHFGLITHPLFIPNGIRELKIFYYFSNKNRPEGVHEHFKKYTMSE